MKIFKSRAAEFTFYGIAFGMLFPIMSMIIDSLIHFGRLSVSNMMTVQTANPLLWVIDSAPFWLGLFAHLAGIREDRLTSLNEALKLEIGTRAEIENNLRQQNELMNDDLEYARVLQNSFLPEIPASGFLTAAYRYLPLKGVGGDLLSMAELHDGSIGIFISDVAGHGVSASLITSLVKVVSDREIRESGSNPELFLSSINRNLLTVIPENNYLTALYAVFEKKGDAVTFTSARAAHPYPVIWKKNSGRSEMITSDGLPICFQENSVYTNRTYSLERGDRIFLFTDGILEGRVKGVRLTGFTGLMRIIDEVNADALPVPETVDKIISLVESFMDGKCASDDRILIGVEIL